MSIYRKNRVTNKLVKCNSVDQLAYNSLYKIANNIIDVDAFLQMIIRNINQGYYDRLQYI